MKDIKGLLASHLMVEDQLNGDAKKNKRPPKRPLQQKHVKERFKYCDKTGDLIWKHYIRAKTRLTGTVAGSIINKKKYKGRFAGRIRIKSDEIKHVHLLGNSYRISAIVWYIKKGYLPKNHLIHIDGDLSNTTIENLKEIEIE